MTSGLDLSDFMGRFRDEAVELVKKLTDGLLKLERNPEDKDVLADLARAAHTLKGNARFMELDAISQIAHRAEDLLSAARDGKLRLTGEATDLMLSCLDDISRLVEAAASGQTAEVDAEAVAARIEASTKRLLARSAPQADEKKASSTSRRKVTREARKEERDPFVTVAEELIGKARHGLEEIKAGRGVSEARDAALRLRDAAALSERLEAEDLAADLAAFLGGVEGSVPEAEWAVLQDAVEALAAIVRGLKPPRAAKDIRRILQAGPAEGRPSEAPGSADKTEPGEGGPSISSEARDALASKTRAAALETLSPRRVRSGITPAAAARAVPAVAETVRVNTSRIDTLVNLVGELVINQRRASEQTGRFKELSYLAKETDKLWQTLRRTIVRGEEEKPPMHEPLTQAELESLLDRYEALSRELREQLGRFAKDLGEEANRLTGSTEKLREHATQLRMLPVSRIFDTFPRAVRDMAREVGKQVDVVVKGGETELDKKMLEGLTGPLTHLLRNCVDHGIEAPEQRVRVGKPPTGTITISAEQEGDHVLIRVADDGRGIDPHDIVAAALRLGIVDESKAQSIAPGEAINLLFNPGLSTRTAVTDISGRGVGLSAVRQDIEDLKGEVDVHSEVGRGTVFTLRLPLTIAILSTVLVSVSGLVYAVPSAYISQALEVMPADVRSVEGRTAVITRARTIPLVDLAEVLELPREKRRAPPRLSVLVLQHANIRIGFVVDAVIGERELVIKGLGSHLRKVRNVAGAAILPTGQITLILHVPELISSARAAAPKPIADRVEREKLEKVQGRVLVVDDSLTSRELEKSILEGAGFTVEMAVDGVDGLRKVGEADFDLIVADLLMPRLDGIEMTKRLKASPRTRNIPVVVVSALDNEVDRHNALSAGAEAFLVKSKLDQRGLLATIFGLIR